MRPEPEVTIVDYGMGNLRSVAKAFERVGARAVVTGDPAATRDAGRLVLPGVGAAGDAAARLRDTGLDDVVRAHVAAGRPFLGICLGLQLLFDESREGGSHRTLGILPGEVVRLDVDVTHGLKVPHMGWSPLTVRLGAKLFDGVADGSQVYFVHAYHARPARREHVSATADHGGPVVAAVERDNVHAVQFHPEKSQDVGLRILANFLKA